MADIRDGEKTTTLSPPLTPTWSGMPREEITAYDVIDKAGADFYEGKALELILGHRRDPAGHAEDLRMAQRLLEEKIGRLVAQANTNAAYNTAPGGGGGPLWVPPGTGGGGSTAAGGGASKGP